MGVIAAGLFGLAGFILGLFVLSGIGLPPDFALGGATFIGAYGVYLGGKT